MSWDARVDRPGSPGDRGFRLAILAVALTLRFAVARSAPLIEVDGAYWAGLARAMLAGDRAHALSAAWPPLYPAVTAFAARVLEAAGAAASPATLEGAARLVSVLCGTLLLLPLGAIARRFLPPRWDLVVMGLAAVHPRLVEYSAAALSESAFTLLLVAGAAGLVVATEGARGTRSWIAAACGGAAAGLSFLVRPEGLLLGAGLAAVAAFARRPRAGAAAAFTVAMVLVALPWLSFLHAETGTWTLGEKGAYNFWRAHRAAYARHFPPPAVLAARVNDSPAIAPRALPGEFRMRELLAAEPLAVVGTTARNLVTLLASTLPVTIGWPVAILALAGLVVARPVPWPLALLLLAPLVDAPFTVDRRLLAPVVPFALLPAAAALAAFARARGAKLAGAITLLLAVGLVAYEAAMTTRRERAPEQRAAGEWLRAQRRAHTPVVMARKPQVAFYANGWIADLPATRDSILADARRIGADVLVADARAARGDRPEIASWLDPAHAPPGWRVLHAWPGEDALVLYGREDSTGSIR